MQLKLNQEEVEQAVIAYLMNKGYELEPTVHFTDDDYTTLETLEAEVCVISHPINK